MVLLSYLARRRGASRRDPLCARLDTSGRFAFPETEAFEAGVPRAHMESGTRGSGVKGKEKSLVEVH